MSKWNLNFEQISFLYFRDGSSSFLIELGNTNINAINNEKEEENSYSPFKTTDILKCKLNSGHHLAQCCPKQKTGV